MQLATAKRLAERSGDARPAPGAGKRKRDARSAPRPLFGNQIRWARQVVADALAQRRLQQ